MPASARIHSLVIALAVVGTIVDANPTHIFSSKPTTEKLKQHELIGRSSIGNSAPSLASSISRVFSRIGKRHEIQAGDLAGTENILGKRDVGVCGEPGNGDGCVKGSFASGVLSILGILPGQCGSETGSCLANTQQNDSPDNTCGPKSKGNYKCAADSAGPCCSKEGFCGGSDKYCGTGCQSSFSLRGTCKARGPSPDNTCGMIAKGNGNGWFCTEENAGPCCSRHGNCGSSPEYCEVGCQKEFGKCDNISQDNRCGPANGNTRCPSGKCCSEGGYCGSTIAHCRSPACQVGFGKCDSDYTPAGMNTSTVARQRPGSIPYGVNIVACKKPGVVALTYDDGPYTYTGELLALLDSYDVKATFFVTGINLGKGSIDMSSTGFPAMLKKMDDDGHQIASHTWSHRDLSTLSEPDRLNEMYKLEMALRNVLNKIPTYMRAPYFSCSTACQASMHFLGYHIIKSTLDTFDYQNNTPEKVQKSKDIVRNALRGADIEKQSFIPLLHDTQAQTVNLTEFALGEIFDRGWKAVTVGECLGDPRENWYRVVE